MIFTTGLLIYHTTLIIRNLTTKEELKGTFKNIFKNPYRRGLFRNLKNIFCPKITKPSLLEKMSIKVYAKKTVIFYFYKCNITLNR